MYNISTLLWSYFFYFGMRLGGYREACGLIGIGISVGEGIRWVSCLTAKAFDPRRRSGFLVWVSRNGSYRKTRDLNEEKLPRTSYPP